MPLDKIQKEILTEIFLRLYRWFLRLKVYLRTLWQNIMLWIGLMFPEWILKLFVETTVYGYTTDNVRLLWVLKYYSDKHSKLKTAFQEEIVTITFVNDKLDSLSEYQIYTHKNEYIYTSGDLDNPSVSSCRFGRNTIGFDKLKSD